MIAVSDPTALAAHADDWDALLARSASNRPCLAPFWLLAWWRVFGDKQGRRLAALLVYDGERLVGLAPFLRRIAWHRRAIPFRRVELLATGEKDEDEIMSDYLGLVAERGYEDDVAGLVATRVTEGALGRCDEVVLAALDGDDPMATIFRRALERVGMRTEEVESTPSPYVRLPATWEAYLSGTSRSGRYFVNRSLRDFERWAGTESDVVRVKTLDDLEEGKRILVGLHQQRWQAQGRAGVFASRLFSSFHDAVLPALLARNALDLCWLRVRGAPVAVAYNIVWDNKVLFYQGGRTLEVPDGVRPGIVLHVRAMQAAIAAGRTEYDFLPGASQYKMQLATATRSVLRLRAARAPLRDLACVALERGLAYLRDRRARAAAPAP